MSEGKNLKLSGTVNVSSQVSEGDNLKFSGTVNVSGQVSEGDDLKPSETVNVSVSGQAVRPPAGSSKSNTVFLLRV